MRKRMKVFHARYIPARLPLGHTVLWWLFLDRIGVSQWIWGIAITLISFVWLIVIWAMFNQETIALRELE